VPNEILDAWRATGARGAAAHAAWRERAEGTETAPAIDSGWLTTHLNALIADPNTVATRKASEMALDAATAAIPALLGGSADLTGSNFTKTASTPVLDRNNYGGRYINYGIREFGMAAAMNGMALHGGIIPYGGTFLIFSDYCRPAIRLSALQGAQAIYVMTHDSIGVGEDGPTHQPIEQIMSLRLIPDLDVFRPCDTVETAECWALAIERRDGPSLLALSRQNLPQLRTDISENWSARGAYRLRSANAARRVILVATGSEVSLAISIADRLEQHGIGADVVSMPSWERFDAQSADYRADVLPQGPLRVSIEAGSSMGWERYVGGGLRFGIDGFGASGPIDALYKHFGLTAETITPRILAELEGN
jgi:transketolase